MKRTIDNKKNPSQIRTKKQISQPLKPAKHPVQISVSKVVFIQR